MNKIVITGNLCKDIELRYTPSNMPVLKNTVAVKNNFKTDNEYKSEFINIVVWNNNAEFLNKYACKGSKVLVEGRLQTKSYDGQDGQKRYITEVVAENVELLNSTKKEEKPVKQDDDPFASFGNEINIDDDFLE